MLAVGRSRRPLPQSYASLSNWRSEAGTVTRHARVREPEVLAEVMSALCAESKRTGSRFSLGALDALQWLTQGGAAPLTGQVTEKPVSVRPVARELAIAEGQTYGRNRDQSQYAQGVLHALMWAQYATAAPPAHSRSGAPGTRSPRTAATTPVSPQCEQRVDVG